MEKRNLILGAAAATMVLTLAISVFAETASKLSFRGYYINGKDIGVIYSHVITKQPDDGYEWLRFEFYKPDESSPSEEILLENGKRGSEAAFYEKVTFVGRKVEYANLGAVYDDYYHSLHIYEKGKSPSDDIIYVHLDW